VAVVVHSQVPLFLQSHSRSRRLYSGLSESCGFRTSFEMVELRSTPAQYSYLAGLLDVFKAKLVLLLSVSEILADRTNSRAYGTMCRPSVCRL